MTAPAGETALTPLRLVAYDTSAQNPPNGTRAPSPGRLHLAWAVLVQSAKDLNRDNGQYWAASIAFYGLISAFPFLLAAVTIASLFVDAGWAAQQATGLLGEFVPEGEAFIERVVDDVVAARGTAGFFSLLLLLWSGSRVFGSLTAALNVAFDVDDLYGFGKRLLIELVMALSVGVVVLLAMSSGLLVDLLWRVLQVLPEQVALYRAVRWGVPAALLLVAHFLVYRYVPRREGHGKSALIGAAVATALFLAARPLFFLYLDDLAEYGLVYGSVGIVIILLVWTWVVALITLFGGEVAAHVQMMVFEGRSAAEVERRHEERSPRRRTAAPGSR